MAKKSKEGLKAVRMSLMSVEAIAKELKLQSREGREEHEGKER